MANTTMNAVVIRRFGGPEVLEPGVVPLPAPQQGEVLVRLEYAGVGEWDPFEREGGYAQMLGFTPEFPYILGSEGAGRVVAVGSGVTGFQVDDPVYAVGFLNPRGGFYAEHAVADANLVAPLPAPLRMEQGAVAAGVGLTALRGLEDVLRLQPGETVLVLGASGGVGHMAVQLAREMGARVMAVASGDDGVALVEGLGAEMVIDGRRQDIVGAARAFAPAGVDAALLTAGGAAAEQALAAVKPGGRAAYPNGVQPLPQAPGGVELQGYNGEPDGEILQRLHGFLARGVVDIHVSRIFAMDEAADAHRAIARHHLGKLALRITPADGGLRHTG